MFLRLYQVNKLRKGYVQSSMEYVCNRWDELSEYEGKAGFRFLSLFIGSRGSRRDGALVSETEILTDVRRKLVLAG